MDPFTGTWIANLSRSRQHPNHQFRSSTLRFKVVGEAVSLTYSGINRDAKEESGTTVLHADGKEYPVPEVDGLVVVTNWISPNVLDSQARKGGQPAGRGTYEVSEDGKSLTATIWGTDASGAPFEHVIVFDRE